MTGGIDTAAPAGNRRSNWQDRLAGPMFFLSVLFLVVLAGLIHRYPRLDPGGLEATLIEGGLGLLWLVFLLEAALRLFLRDGRQGVRGLTSAVVGGLLPPLRMASRSPVAPDHIWLPGLGWQKIDAPLRRRLERFFSVPMIFFALMVLPLFVLEFYWAEQVRAEPALALALDVGTSVIWLAFSVELILMVAVADRPVRYCFTHWIDVAIVLLPAVEVMPLFRLLRLGRVLRLEQLLRWGRLHRLQAVAMRGWRAILLLQIVQRLSGRSPEYQYRKLQELLQAREEEVADLRREIRELGERIARKAPDREAAAVPAPANAPEDPAGRARSPAGGDHGPILPLEGGSESLAGHPAPPPVSR
jgi:voltage-gated potassium channel